MKKKVKEKWMWVCDYVLFPILIIVATLIIIILGTAIILLILGVI